MVDFPDRVHQRLDHDRRQTQRRLVQHQQARPAHQRAADRHHLLLAAGQRAGKLALPFRQPRKQRMDAPQVGGDAGAVAARIGAHRQVLRHAQGRPQLAFFRAMGKAAPHDLFRRQAINPLLLKMDGAGGHLHQAGNRAQQRGLAGAVGAHQGHQLAGAHPEADIMHRANPAIAAGDALKPEHRSTRCPDRPRPPAGRPRCRRACPRRSFRHDAAR